MMNKVFIVFVIIKIFMVSYASLLPTKQMETNYFYQVHSHVQKAVNGIFLLLKINQNFTSIKRNRFLLTVHAAMKTLAVRNFKKFEQVKTAARLETRKKPTDVLFDLDKLVKILITENLLPDHHIKFFNKSENNNSMHLKITSLEIPEKSEESFAFLKEHFYQTGEAELLETVKSPLNKIKKAYIKKRKKRNLKKWAPSNVTKSEKQPNDTRRIFQGVGTSIRMYSFVASVHVMGDFVCSGSIVSHGLVITAATCVQVAFNNSRFFKDNRGGISVRIGSDFSLRFGALCFVFKIYFHPHFDPVTLRNNLAILMIDDKPYVSVKHDITRIEYPITKGPLGENITSISVLGWGDKVATGYNGVDRLSISKIDIINLEKCKNTYSRKFVSDKNFCTGFETTGSGACQRDVGGPGIFNSILVGVVSFGPPSCGLPDAPTAFTDLGHYVDWIDSIVKKKVLVSRYDAEKKTNEMLLPKISMEEPTLNVLPERNVRARFKSKMGVRAKANPKHIQILNYLLHVLVGGKNQDQINDYQLEDIKNSDEIKRSQRQYTMQVAVIPTITKHVHNFSPSRSQKESIYYNLGINNINSNERQHKQNQSNIFSNDDIIDSTFHRYSISLRGYLGLSDIIKKEIKDTPSKTQSESKEDDFTTSQEIFVKSHVNPQMLWTQNNKIDMQQTKSVYVKNEIKNPELHFRHSDKTETDNYENDSENTLSIEIPSEIPLAKAVAVIMSTTKSIAMHLPSKLIMNDKGMLSQKETVSNTGKRYRIPMAKTHHAAHKHSWRNREHDASNSFMKSNILENIVIERTGMNRHKIDFSISSTVPPLAAQIPSVVARNGNALLFEQGEELEKMTFLINDSASTDSEIDYSSFEDVTKNKRTTDNEFTTFARELSKGIYKKGSEKDKREEQTKQYILNKTESKFETIKIVDFDAIAENHRSTSSYFKERQIKTDVVIARNKAIQEKLFFNSHEQKKETGEHSKLHLLHQLPTHSKLQQKRTSNLETRNSTLSSKRIHFSLKNPPNDHKKQDVVTSTSSKTQTVQEEPFTIKNMETALNFNSHQTDVYPLRESLTPIAYGDKKAYAFIMTSTVYKNTPRTPVTIASTAAERSLHETADASEEDSFLDLGFPFNTTNDNMPIASREDEYDHYNEMLSEFFGNEISEILNSSK